MKGGENKMEKFEARIQELIEKNENIHSLETIREVIIHEVEIGNYLPAKQILSQLCEKPVAEYYEIDLTAISFSKLKPLYTLKDLESYEV